MKNSNYQKISGKFVRTFVFHPFSESWEFCNSLKVQNPLYAVEITVCATTAPGDSKRVLAFCRQIHTWYAQKLCISTEFKPLAQKIGMILLVYVGHSGWWGFFSFVLGLSFLFVCLFVLFICFLWLIFLLFVLIFKLWKKCRARVYTLLENHPGTNGTYQNWVHHCQMSFCRHVMNYFGFKQTIILKSDLKAARDLLKGSNG